MTTIVVGYKGFIGSRVYNFLQMDQFPLIGVSRDVCDLSNRAEVFSFFETVAEPFNIIFCSVIDRGVDNSWSSFQSNIAMVKNCVDCVKKSDLIKSMVYLSSVDVYGASPVLPITENTPSNPRDFYGLAKYVSEIIFSRGLEKVCPVTILRLPGIYDAGGDTRSVVGRYINEAKSKGTVELQGSGAVLRDYVCVSDLCNLIMKVLNRPASGVFNVASGTSFKLTEIVERISAKFDAKIKRSSEDKEGRSYDLVFDVSRLKQNFGIDIRKLSTVLGSGS